MNKFKIIILLFCTTLTSLLSGCSKDPFSDEYTNIMLDKFVFSRDANEISVEELVIYYYETKIDHIFFYEITFTKNNEETTLIYTYKMNMFDTVFTPESAQTIPEFESNYNKYKEAVKENNKKVYINQELKTLINDAFNRKEI